MLKKIKIIASREYWKLVTKPTFWIATLILPILILVTSLISGYSASVVEKKLTQDQFAGEKIVYFDSENWIDKSLLPAQITKTNDLNQSIEQIKKGELNALFIYQKNDLLAKKQINIFVKSEGIISQGKYNSIATKLLQTSIALELSDQAKASLLLQTPTVKVTAYKNGEIVGLQKFILPAIAVIIYFLLIMFSTNYLLMSISEEKENRMIEIILSIVSARELIWGKLIGLTGVVLSQLMILSSLSLAVMLKIGQNLPVTISLHDLQDFGLGRTLLVLYFVMTGFALMAGLMVGVGSIMPNYREAQQLSTVFIMLSIFPIYFASILIVEPAGIIAKITSFFPLTASLILLFRVAFESISGIELFIGMLTALFWAIAGLWLAFWLFEKGSLEYNNRLSLKNIVMIKKKKVAKKIEEVKEEENIIIQDGLSKNELLNLNQKLWANVKQPINGFGSFLSQRDVVAMAVGVIIADSVKQLVNSLVTGLINPFIKLFSPNTTQLAGMTWHFRGSDFKIGEVLSVLIQMFILFILIYIVVRYILRKEEFLTNIVNKK